MDQLYYNILTYFKQGLKPLFDPFYLMILVLGLGAWFFPPPKMNLAWSKLLYLAFFEELIFRFGLQETLNRQLTINLSQSGLSLANILTSCIFALLHLFQHPPLWSLLVFLPSLIFGWVWDRYKNILPCWLAHFLYNYIFFYRP